MQHVSSEIEIVNLSFYLLLFFNQTLTDLRKMKMEV